MHGSDPTLKFFSDIKKHRSTLKSVPYIYEVKQGLRLMTSQGEQNISSRVYNHLDKKEASANGRLAGSNVVLELICWGKILFLKKKTRDRDTRKKGKTLDAFHFSKWRSKCNIKMMLILYKLAALHQTHRTYCTT